MTAAREYRALQSEIRGLIERLPEALNAHGARAQEHPGHWSFVGDLKRARLDLLRIAAALGDEPSREVLFTEGVDR